MTTFNGERVTHKGGSYGRGDDPHGITSPTYRRQTHPGQDPNSQHDSVGRYLGSAGPSHFFSAESTGGGETDSHVLTDPEGFKFYGEPGGLYTFNRQKGHTGSVSSYNSKHDYGIAGAPLKDTPAEMEDNKYKKQYMGEKY
jgi:hypothetical protein